MSAPPVAGAVAVTLPLDRQRVLVTGAAEGLGAAVARHLAGRGARLVLLDRREAALAATAAACGPGAESLVVDLCDAAAARRAFDAAARRGPIHAAVHNAAILRPRAFAAEDFEGFRTTLAVGLDAGFLMARALWPGMVADGGGMFVFVSSRSGTEGFADEAAYCAAKHGLEGLSKSLALAGAPHAILSTTVTPGHPMRTPMSERNYGPAAKAVWVDPARLAPAFSRLVEERDPRLSGRQVSAWVHAGEAR